MSEEEVDFTPKLNCGVWTAIENLINKGNNEMIWDNKNVPPKVTVTRKKEKFRIGKKISPPVLSTLVTRRRSAPSRRASESGSITGRINSAQIASTPRIANGNPSGSPFVSAGAFAFAKTFAQKAMIVRKSRNEHAEEVFERSRQMLESCNFATIDCSFNLPRVNAQLERLMGSNVVHLTDRKYMVELRRRITEDFENMLMKRINQRKQEEVERQMKLLLHGLYNVQNVPPKLISAHSIVLAEEIQRQRVLLMDGKLLKCPKELRNHPVLIINESTNKFLIKRRAKLKTERERVSERIIRLGKKWEADHLLWEEREKQKEVEMKLKEMEMLASDKHYFAHLESVNGRVNLEKKFQKTELNMVAFLVKEKQLMQNRLKPKEKEFKPFTKDIRVVDAKRRMSEASVHKLKSLAAKIRATNPLEDSSEDKTEDKTEEKTDTQSRDQDQDSIVTQSESTVEKKKKKGSILSIFKSKNKNKSKNKRKKDETTSQGEETTSQAEPSLGEPSSPEQSPKAEKHHKESTDSSIESELSKVVVRIDPVVQELKGAKNVTELYRIAEQIVGTNIDNILDKSKSNEDDE